MVCGSTVLAQGQFRRYIGAIGWLMYRMHIGTIIVCVGSSTVLATGSFRWQCNASNGVIFIGKSARNLVGRSHVYQHNGNWDHRCIGIIGIVIVGIAALSVCQRYMAV